jgi:lipid-binding SYLF domain-containing protein
MKTTHIQNFLVIVLICVLTVTAHAADDSKKEKNQNDIRKMTHDTLQTLYKVEPKSKEAVKHAAGYAVFSNLGVKILLAGSGNGKGLAINNKTKKETFMKMLQVQAGLGMGVKKFRVVFLFDNETALNGFVNSGWDFGGQSTAAAKNGDKGAAMSGAMSVSDGVWMYQLTDKGLAAEISATGTKYYKDDNLN